MPPCPWWHPERHVHASRGVIPSGAQRSRGTCSLSAGQQASQVWFVSSRVGTFTLPVVSSRAERSEAEGPAVCPPASKRPKFGSCHPERHVHASRGVIPSGAQRSRGTCSLSAGQLSVPSLVRVIPSGTFTLPVVSSRAERSEAEGPAVCPRAQDIFVSWYTSLSRSITPLPTGRFF